MTDTPLRDRIVKIVADPALFYPPAYLGSKRWVGVRLHVDEVDWGEISELITEAYRLPAPRRLVAHLDG